LWQSKITKQRKNDKRVRYSGLVPFYLCGLCDELCDLCGSVLFYRKERKAFIDLFAKLHQYPFFAVS